MMKFYAIHFFRLISQIIHLTHDSLFLGKNKTNVLVFNSIFKQCVPKFIANEIFSKTMSISGFTKRSVTKKRGKLKTFFSLIVSIH